MEKAGPDLKKFKGMHETEKEWQLKKLFIETHYGKFPDERLASLAQCYANTEILGCRYPNEVMAQIKELTKDFAPKVQELLKQNDNMKQLGNKLNDIKFKQNTNNDDDKNEKNLKTPIKIRNKLLNTLLNQTSTSKQPHIIQINTNINETSKNYFEKLRNIELLRNTLRKYLNEFNKYLNSSTDKYIDLFINICKNSNININLIKKQNTDLNLYEFELYLDDFRVSESKDKEFYLYKYAFDLLTSSCVLSYKKIDDNLVQLVSADADLFTNQAVTDSSSSNLNAADDGLLTNSKVEKLKM